jgi:hypothetical protein
VSSLENQITSLETTLKQTSDKILDLTRSLCDNILDTRTHHRSKKKIRRQVFLQKKKAVIINKHLHLLTQLRRKIKTLRKQHRRTPAPAISAETGSKVKKELLEPYIPQGTTSYFIHGLSATRERH